MAPDEDRVLKLSAQFRWMGSLTLLILMKGHVGDGACFRGF
jgi:hypothetical protein